MAVTPLPPENTKRYFFLTLVGSDLHRTQVRVSDAVGDADAVDGFRFDFTLLKTAMGNNVHIVGLEVAEKGSNVRNVVSGWTQIDGLATNDPIAGQHLCRTFSCRGRSKTGRKFRMLLWGLALPESDDWQYDPPVGDLRTFMSTSLLRSDTYLAIDGTKPVMRTDLLEDYNDHWESEKRP